MNGAGKCELCGRPFTVTDALTILPDRHDDCHRRFIGLLEGRTKVYEEMLTAVRLECAKVIGAGAMVKLEPVENRVKQVIDELMTALERSVELQSHYAGLLNQYDGGERLQFENAEAWVRRLYEVKIGVADAGKD
jgi:hypothetical protein